MKLAIFDFDGTLFQDETYDLLKKALKRHPQLQTKYKRYILSLVWPYYGYKLKLYPEVKMKHQVMERYLHNFVGYSKEEMDSFFTAIAKEMIGREHPAVVDRLLAHKKAGYHTMVVSGSFTPLLKAFLQDLPIDTIIGTKIPFKNGIYDIDQTIDYVQAGRKASLVETFATKHTIDWDNSFSYADSFTDLPILQLVGNPVVVAPEERLKEIALANNWEMID